MSKTMPRFGIAFVVMLSLLQLQPTNASAEDHRFSDYVSHSGCDSIIFYSRRSTCHSKQSEKNTACNQRLQCDLNRATRYVDDYRKAVSHLARVKGTKDEDSVARSLWRRWCHG